MLARIPEGELASLFRGYGYEPLVFTAGFDDEDVLSIHGRFAELLDRALDDRRAMIVFRTPKGWTGPREVDGLPVEGTWRAHQVPLAEVRTNPQHLRQLEGWLRSYRPEELFDEQGTLLPELAAVAPAGERRMSANPKTNGGLVLRDLELPDFRAFAVAVERAGGRDGRGDPRARPLARRGRRARTQRTSASSAPTRRPRTGSATCSRSPTSSGTPQSSPTDESLAPSGRVVEMLSEHQCQGWLEGYLLTGRHGLFNCYEAFIHIVDSMFNQHAKWLKVTRGIAWRRPLASLNYLLSRTSGGRTTTASRTRTPASSTTS